MFRKKLHIYFAILELLAENYFIYSFDYMFIHSTTCLFIYLCIYEFVVPIYLVTLDDKINFRIVLHRGHGI